MSPLVFIDGQRVAPSQAVVPVLDRGFLYGDSVFEVLRTYEGVPFALRAHIERLRASCEKLRIPLDIDDDALSGEIATALAAAGYREAYIRVVVTRGVTPLGLHALEAPCPRRILVVAPLPSLPDDFHRKGVEVSCAARLGGINTSATAGAKASNYLANILALRDARERGGHEAINIGPGGELLEGATSNLFLVRKGQLYTPPLSLGILGGITRRHVLAAAFDAGLPAHETLLFPCDLYRADEAFITSSLREVVGVVRADGAPIGSGAVGGITRQLHQAFRQYTTSADA